MAIYHLRVKTVSRGGGSGGTGSGGRSVVAAAAYRSGQVLADDAAGRMQDYTDRAGRVLFAGIFLPFGAPAWARDRATLWNAVERVERRRDATLAREIELSLPHELTDQQRLQLVRDFVRENLVRRGLAVDVAIHGPEPGRGGDARNVHAHILIAERQLGPGGFAARKDRGLQSKATLYGWRANWATLCNRYLANHGHAVRVDHRSFRARGIVDRQPMRTRSPAVIAMQRRRGVVPPRGAQQGAAATAAAVVGQARDALRQGWTGAGKEAGRQSSAVATVSQAREVTGQATRQAWQGGAGEGCGRGTVHARQAWCPAQSPQRDGAYGRHAARPDQLRGNENAQMRPVLAAAVVTARPDGSVTRPARQARNGPGFHAADTGTVGPPKPSRAGSGAAMAALASLAAVVPERAVPDAAREVCSRGPPALGREVSPAVAAASGADSSGEVEPCSYEAEAEGIRLLYARQIDGIRQTNMPRWMMKAAIRAVREAQRAALAAMRERRYWRRQRSMAKLVR